MDLQKPPARNKLTVIAQSLEKYINELKKLIKEIEKEEYTDQINNGDQENQIRAERKDKDKA